VAKKETLGETGSGSHRGSNCSWPAFGLFYCSGQDLSRKPDKMAVITLRRNPKKKTFAAVCPTNMTHCSITSCLSVAVVSLLQLQLQFVPVGQPGTYKLSNKLGNVAPKNYPTQQVFICCPQRQKSPAEKFFSTLVFIKTQ